MLGFHTCGLESSSTGNVFEGYIPINDDCWFDFEEAPSGNGLFPMSESIGLDAL